MRRVPTVWVSIRGPGSYSIRMEVISDSRRRAVFQLLGSAISSSSSAGRSPCRAVCSSRTGTTSCEKQTSRLSSCQADSEPSRRVLTSFAQATSKLSGYWPEAMTPKRCGRPSRMSRM